MKKTTFKISKMDCPSEEGIIKMKLSGQDNIKSLRFDIPNRILEVFHSDENEEIFKLLESLNFGTSIISTEEITNLVIIDNSNNERKLLWQVLFINFLFFVLELLTGILSNSMGLVADGLDMLADSIVYGLALYAVGHSITAKNKVATVSGYFQLILAILGFTEVLRRFLGYETTPNFWIMIIISILALIGNTICLYLLQKSKSTGNHMKASMIFTSNDIVVNIGVIVAGSLVYITNSKFPDLIIGAIIFIIVGRGAMTIFKLAK
jgi:Co/Zn/Cd efflux system component